MQGIWQEYAISSQKRYTRYIPSTSFWGLVQVRIGHIVYSRYIFLSLVMTRIWQGYDKTTKYMKNVLVWQAYDKHMTKKGGLVNGVGIPDGLSHVGHVQSWLQTSRVQPNAARVVGSAIQTWNAESASIRPEWCARANNSTHARRFIVSLWRGPSLQSASPPLGGGVASAALPGNPPLPPGWGIALARDGHHHRRGHCHCSVLKLE